jgi:uncharacterized protein (DUF1800 family)
MRKYALFLAAVPVVFSAARALAIEAVVTNLVVVSNRMEINIRPDDEMNVLQVLTSSNLVNWVTNASSLASNSALVGHTWTLSNLASTAQFVRVQAVPISSQRQLAAHVLSRLAYGPTPYEMGRILGYKTNTVVNSQGTHTYLDYGEGIADGGIGVDAWINEQLNPAAIVEDVTNQFVEIAPIYNRFGDLNTVVLTNHPSSPSFPETNGPGTLNFHDFRAWFALHGIGARRQLHEVLLYWLENHFVSQWTKARETWQGSYNQVGGAIQDRIPTKMEAEEHRAFRAAMMRTNITFRELLRLQHESQSMTVYLDTNDSVGSGNNVANENYAREIMELYSMGVDNGYDQGDITAMSLAWTGWDVRKVAPENVTNLYAHQEAPLTNFLMSPPSAAISNTYGVFALQFRRTVHGHSNLFIWYNRNSIGAISNNYPNGQLVAGTNGFKRVPSRFNGSGMTPPLNYTTLLYGTNTVPGSYALRIAGTTNNDASRAAMTNKVYTIMDFMADLPFTQEFISVKLCQLLVHDNFDIGYDFSDASVTPEEQLVWNCMMTWQNGSPKGQIYQVIKTITDSALFRSQAAYRRKIKTPLEFTLSAVRALRVATNENYTAGNFSATTDGYSIVSGATAQTTAHPLNRMGRFLIFDREEPDGYPETGTVYVGANGLAERVRWVNSILTDPPTADNINGGNNTRIDPLGVIERFLSTGLRRNADEVARLFLRLLYPGEGGANLDQYRRLAVQFLNTSDSGTASNFSGLTYGSSTYNNRVRRMVAMLMSMPRFNEQ